MQIKVIGKGAWGQSIASLLEENHHTVVFLTRGEIKLEDQDLVVLALPTNAIRGALSVAKDVKNLTIINCSKGIERETHKLPFEIVKEVMHPTTNYFTLLGPSFAHELQEKMPTMINLGCSKKLFKEADLVKELFETSYLRIHIVTGVPALETAASMKNVYAIACGMADGIGFGMNTRTRVIVTAIGEFYELCRGLGYEIDTKAMSGIIGDFMLTGGSVSSRNFQFGKFLADHSVEESLKLVGATVEGYHAVSSLSYLADEAQVTLPLGTLVMDMVDNKNNLDLRAAFIRVAETM